MMAKFLQRGEFSEIGVLADFAGVAKERPSNYEHRTEIYWLRNRKSMDLKNRLGLSDKACVQALLLGVFRAAMGAQAGSIFSRRNQEIKKTSSAWGLSRSAKRYVRGSPCPI